MSNKETLKQLREKFKTFKSKPQNQVYSKFIDFTETDSDEDEDLHNKVVDNTNQKFLNEVFYRGVCELDSDRNTLFNKSQVCCYNISFYNKFPILLFLFEINSDNQIDFLKYSGSIIDIISDLKKDTGYTEVNKAGVYNKQIPFLNINDKIQNRKVESLLWITPEEIINNKQVFHYKFSSHVQKLFTNKNLLYLENQNKETFQNLPTGYLIGAKPYELIFGPLTKTNKAGYVYAKQYSVNSNNVSRSLLFTQQKENSTSSEIIIKNLNQQMPLDYL